MYILSSYDSFPDNQQIALNANVYYYAFFVIFIFFNVFFFVVIPATLIFQSFREIKSKIMFVDEVKQQHSLIFCFVSLGENNFSITPKQLIKFLLFAYNSKIRYIQSVIDICMKLDQKNSG